MFSRTHVVTFALAATLLIGACGSDEGGAGAGGDTIVVEATTTAPAATETTVAESTQDTTPSTTQDTTQDTIEDTTATTDAPAQDVEADTAAAQSALVTLAELPEGWSETPADGTATNEIDGRLAECIGVESSGAVGATGDFSSPDGNLVVSESVGVQATERDARLVIAQLTNPEVPGCVATAYAELGDMALSAGAIAGGAVIGEVTATRLAVGAAGDATQAIRVVIPVTYGETTTLLTIDQVVVRSGRSVATISFEGRVEATTVETIDEITAAAASRLPV